MPAPKIRSRADAKFASAPTDPEPAIAPPAVAPGLSAFRNAAPTSRPPCSYCAPTLHCRLFANPVSLLKLYVPPNEKPAKSGLAYLTVLFTRNVLPVLSLSSGCENG